MKQTVQRLAVLAALGALAMAGCTSPEDSGGDRAGSSRPTGADSDAPAQRGESADPEQASGTDSEQTSGTDPAGTHIARTAGLRITVADVEEASATVRSTASGAGGYVSSEETRVADEDESTTEGSWAEIVVTVPVADLEPTMATLSRVGTVTQRTSDATDLSQQYTDTRARVSSMKKSIARLRALIDEAEDLEQVVDLENELATREADLESKVSQQKSLEKRTTTAPITVRLATADTSGDTDTGAETGFLAGLQQGWSGFTGALTLALTALGAVTPFVLTSVVVLGPTLWWLRRRAARTHAG
ncbi:DUF4349 domain-containing protein [Janibacter sp. GS2]|uniref:DUF4349 domain-containing protein n=1 Tax=Janibacter sp. GS2 TaxID=3442646 RepID=UPI003EC0FC45